MHKGVHAGMKGDRQSLLPMEGHFKSYKVIGVELTISASMMYSSTYSQSPAVVNGATGSCFSVNPNIPFWLLLYEYGVSEPLQQLTHLHQLVQFRFLNSSGQQPWEGYPSCCRAQHSQCNGS